MAKRATARGGRGVPGGQPATAAAWAAIRLSSNVRALSVLAADVACVPGPGTVPGPSGGTGSRGRPGSGTGDRTDWFGDALGQPFGDDLLCRGVVGGLERLEELARFGQGAGVFLDVASHQ